MYFDPFFDLFLDEGSLVVDDCIPLVYDHNVFLDDQDN